jgi:hypothetical protein
MRNNTPGDIRMRIVHLKIGDFPRVVNTFEFLDGGPITGRSFVSDDPCRIPLDEIESFSWILNE